MHWRAWSGKVMLDKFKCVCAVLDGHRVEASAAIIIGLAIILSPYLLIALVVLFLVVGVPNLPSFLRPLLPAPIVQVSSSALNASSLRAHNQGVGSGVTLGAQYSLGVGMEGPTTQNTTAR